MLKFSYFEIQEPWIVSETFVIYFDFLNYILNSVESYGSLISNMLNFSMRFPLEFYDGFDWFKNPSGSFACWFRCTKPFFNFLFSWGTFPSAKIMDILVIISLLAGARGLKFSALGWLWNANHMIIKVFRNSKILHFLGVKSEFYQLRQQHTALHSRTKDHPKKISGTIKNKRKGLINNLYSSFWWTKINLYLLQKTRTPYKLYGEVKQVHTLKT